MGYSVYITLDQADLTKAKRFADNFSLFNFPCRGILLNDLSYTNEAHENYLGCDYSHGYYQANTTLMWLAKKFNKSFYWYDGFDKILVTENTIVHPPITEDYAAFMRANAPHLLEENIKYWNKEQKELERLLSGLEKEWERIFKNP